MRQFAILGGADGPRLQALLAAAVAEWKAAGLRVAGVIAEAHDLPDRACSAGFLRNIGSGSTYSMFLEVPPAGTSCHLDATGVQGACKEVLSQIAHSDVVVLSKFGKPVLTTVSDLHRAACHQLAPGALRLPPDAAAIRDWWAGISTLAA